MDETTAALSVRAVKRIHRRGFLAGLALGLPLGLAVSVAACLALNLGR